MAGSRRGHRRRRGSRPPRPTPTLLPDSSTHREVAIAQSSYKKTCHASISASSAMYGPQGWADLPDSLFHHIITLFSSCLDILAFIGTCRSWRAAVSSYPSVLTFTFPPLLLQPNIQSSCRCLNRFTYNLLFKRKWQLVDPANPTSSIHCSMPQNTVNNMRYVGCSYSHLIFSYHEQCLLVDVCTGVKVKPPQLPPPASKNYICYGTLTAPLTSPDSYLLFCSRFSLFQWQVGSYSWLEHPLDGIDILCIMVFKGEIFAMDSINRLFTVRLAPRFSIQQVAVEWGEDMPTSVHFKPWLVVCGDMLLLVDYAVGILEEMATFQAFRLDMLAEPAKWINVQKLENWALFVGIDRRSPTFSCMNPERWGGKSNFVYLACASERWTGIQLGQRLALNDTLDCCTEVYSGDSSSCLKPFWVFPSIISCVGQ